MKSVILGLAFGLSSVVAQANTTQDFVEKKLFPTIQSEIKSSYKDIELILMYNRPDKELEDINKKYRPESKNPIKNNETVNKDYRVDGKLICTVHVSEPKHDPDFFPENFSQNQIENMLAVSTWHEVGHCIQDYHIYRYGGSMKSDKLNTYRYELTSDLYSYVMAWKTIDKAEEVIELSNSIREELMFDDDLEHSTNLSYPNYKENLREIAKSANVFEELTKSMWEKEPSNNIEYLAKWKHVAQIKSQKNLKLSQYENNLLKDENLKSKSF